MATLEYEPKIPTVYLVVDRSGSMFHCLASTQNVCPNKADTSWSQLKTAIQSVITQLEAQVRFGFTTIYGTDPSTPGADVPGGHRRHARRQRPPEARQRRPTSRRNTTVSPWPLESRISTSGKKFESPASYAITAATKALMNFTAPG